MFDDALDGDPPSVGDLFPDLFPTRTDAVLGCTNRELWVFRWENTSGTSGASVNVSPCVHPTAIREGPNLFVSNLLTFFGTIA